MCFYVIMDVLVFPLLITIHPTVLQADLAIIAIMCLCKDCQTIKTDCCLLKACLVIKGPENCQVATSYWWPVYTVWCFSRHCKYYINFIYSCSLSPLSQLFQKQLGLLFAFTLIVNTKTKQKPASLLENKLIL